MITCSDSRILPDYITNAQPGDLFILRNAGNLAPPDGASNGGEAATIEFAVQALRVSHIIVMGHSHCGAMKALMNPEDLRDLPRVAAWLKHAESVRLRAHEKYADCKGEDLLNSVIKENVLEQLENLRTYPDVAAKLAEGQIKLHAWVYEFESGRVLAYDPVTSHFAPVTDKLKPE